MRKMILFMPTPLQIFFIVGMTVLSAFVIALSCSFFFDVDKLAANTELTSTIYQVMGTIYAILLTFTLWGVWQKFNEAGYAVQHEAYSLLNMVHLIEASESLKSFDAREVVVQYINFAKRHIWPTKNEVSNLLDNTHTWNYQVCAEIIQKIQGLKPQNTRDEVIFSQILQLLNNWFNARRTRILLMQGNSAKALWPLLIIGALVLFGFHGLFVAKTVAIWATLLFGFSLVIGLTFYLIFTFDTPFAGTPRIDKESFDLAVETLKVK